MADIPHGVLDALSTVLLAACAFFLTRLVKLIDQLEKRVNNHAQRLARLDQETETNA